MYVCVSVTEHQEAMTLILLRPYFSKAFPRKSSITKTPRLTSDSDIQGSKDAVIQDLERKLRFKEERMSNGQQVCVCVCVISFIYRHNCVFAGG